MFVNEGDDSADTVAELRASIQNHKKRLCEFMEESKNRWLARKRQEELVMGDVLYVEQIDSSVARGQANCRAARAGTKAREAGIDGTPRNYVKGSGR